jgi:hypothetical protein
MAAPTETSLELDYFVDIGPKVVKHGKVTQNSSFTCRKCKQSPQAKTREKAKFTGTYERAYAHISRQKGFGPRSSG